MEMKARKPENQTFKDKLYNQQHSHNHLWATAPSLPQKIYNENPTHDTPTRMARIKMTDDTKWF